MAGEKAIYEPIEGEDFIILTPEKNATTILPWNLRVVSNQKYPIRVDFRHTNLMTKVLVISDEEESASERVQKEEKITERIGKEI